MKEKIKDSKRGTHVFPPQQGITKAASSGLRTHRGFSFLEVIVSVFIFALIMISMTFTYGRFFVTNKKTQTIQKNAEEARFAMELMAKSLRTSTVLSCRGITPCPLGSSPTSIEIYDLSQSKCIRYYFDLAQGKLKTVSANIDKSLCNAAAVPINASDADLISNFIGDGFFVVSPSETGTAGKITISAKICSIQGCLGLKNDQINLETSVSLRNFVNPATKGGDSVSPTVSITAPANNATVSGANVTISATASDNVGVVSIQFQVDGTNIGAAGTTSPYSISWNSTAATNGSHALTAVARDAAGNQTTSSTVTVTTNNDLTAPTVSITAPANGATVSGASVTVSANASDTGGSGMASVQFKIGASNIGSADTTSPYSVTLDTTSYSNGSYDLTAVATDGAGNSTTSTAVTVTVNNDTTSPTVSITAPTNGATVSGASVTVSATASDNVGVSGVQFKLDGANLSSEDTSSPYSITWNTTTATNGAHTLTAVARDAATNSTTSSAVTVTVSNTTLIGWWKMDDGTGLTAADSSGNGRTGTLTNGPTWTTGLIAGALNFDGTNDYVSVGTFNFGSVFTISGWVNINGGASDIQTIMANTTSGDISNGFKIFVNTWSTSNKSLWIETGNGTANSSAVTAAGAVLYPGWHHIVAVLNRTSGLANAYVDGVQVITNQTIRTDFGNNQATRIGQMTSNTYPFGGSMDDVRIYNVALTAAEVQALYTAGAGTPVACSAQTIDQSNHDWTIENSIFFATDSWGQTFTAGSSGSLSSIRLYVYDSRGGGQTLTLRFDDDSDMTSEFISQITTTIPNLPQGSWIDIPFPAGSRPSLISGQTYYFLMQTSGDVGIQESDLNPYNNGEELYSFGGGWSDSSPGSIWDAKFETVMCDSATGSVAGSGTGYVWSNSATATSNTTRTANTAVNDDNTATTASCATAGGAVRWNGAGVTFATAKNNVSKVEFVNGDEYWGDGPFDTGITLQLSTNGTTWTDSGWTISPDYSYDANVGGNKYTFTGTPQNGIMGARVMGTTGAGSYFFKIKEFYVYDSGTVASASDTFVRLDETPLVTTGNWAEMNASTHSIHLHTNKVVADATSTSNSHMYRDNEIYASNQFSQAVIAGSAVPAAEIGGPGVRYQRNGPDINMYMFTVLNSTTGAVYALYGPTGTWEQIGTNITSTFAVGNTIKIQIVGNVITVYKNGVSIGSRTDANNRIPAGGTPGLEILHANTGFTTWTGGSL